ncbi:MAG TPA: acyl carrier protein [Candidatus Ornithoclostridium faecavium]|nr:acyl carrier protein [Candidatus Ornithoclostridium faecavium]
MVLEKVKQIIAGKMSISEDEITVDTKLKEDLQADSLDMVELVMAAEDEFGVEIEEDAVREFVTVGDVVKYIEANKK